MAPKLNSTRLTLLKVDKVDLSLRPRTHWRQTKSTVSATKSTELATESTAKSCQIQVVADLSPKPATKSTVLATVDFVADLSPVSATIDFVVSLYRTLDRIVSYPSYREFADYHSSRTRSKSLVLVAAPTYLTLAVCLTELQQRQTRWIYLVIRHTAAVGVLHDNTIDA